MASRSQLTRQTLFLGIFVLVVVRTAPGFAENSLLFETWAQSYFSPARLDEFIEAHRAEYTDEYFRCSQEAQRLIQEEARVRDRQCDFASESGVRSRCRKENQFRGLDQHLAELDQTIRSQRPWKDQESGRNALTAVRAAESCTPPACEIIKRRKNELERALSSYLQCPPGTDRPADVDPTFKKFQFPTDQGG
jgi:hypothetical protein